MPGGPIHLKQRSQRGSGPRRPVPMEVRPEIGAPFAAGLTHEQRLKIGQAHMIRPTVGADLNAMAAPIIGAVDQKATNAHLSHFA
jgi:hypothetical protein